MFIKHIINISKVLICMVTENFICRSIFLSVYKQYTKFTKHMYLHKTTKTVKMVFMKYLKKIKRPIYLS